MSIKTYVVTGAASGIGAALAGVLKAADHRVIGLDIADDPGNLDQFIKVDLDDPASIRDALAAIDEPVAGLCNSAGLPPRSGLEAKILSVNFYGTRAFTDGVKNRMSQGGAVVNLASRAGHRWPDNVDQVKRLAASTDPTAFVEQEKIDPVRAYDLSKEAVILWTMASSEAYSNQGLRINSISPGAVDTAIMADFETAFGARMSKNVARAGRAGTAREIAELAAFLLSPKSGWIKGTDISIDGGMSAFNGSDAMGLDALL